MSGHVEQTSHAAHPGISEEPCIPPPPRPPQAARGPFQYLASSRQAMGLLCREADRVQVHVLQVEESAELLLISRGVRGVGALCLPISRCTIIQPLWEPRYCSSGLQVTGPTGLSADPPTLPRLLLMMSDVAKSSGPESTRAGQPFCPRGGGGLLGRSGHLRGTRDVQVKVS